LASLLLFNIRAVVRVSAVADVQLLCLSLFSFFHLCWPPCSGWLPAVFSIHAVVGDFAGVGSLLLTLFLLLLASLPFFSKSLEKFHEVKSNLVPLITATK
jgi:hypothetical protein